MSQLTMHVADLGRDAMPRTASTWWRSARRTDHVLRFGGFRAVPESRTLLFGDAAVPLGSRAFDLLMVLLRWRGGVVSKAEIVRQVWPTTTVDECNLRFQIGVLRKALGPERDRIKTIPGRGYFFAADRDDATDEPDRAGRNEVALVDEDHGPRDACVVVIDAQAETRDATADLLGSFGLAVTRFGSVEDYLADDGAADPACFILDAWLPGRGGLDFQADLAGAGMHVPVIFASGRADVPMAVRAMKAGALEFLTKPVRHEDLIEAVGRAVSMTGSDLSGERRPFHLPTSSHCLAAAY